MAWEAIAAVVVGLALLALVFEPLLRPVGTRAPITEPEELEDTRKGKALVALREIEFDRETGKLSDEDYEQLKARYTTEALNALRAETPQVEVDDVEGMIAARVKVLRSAATSTPPNLPSCVRCGPRPETDALYCSTCGDRLLSAHHCAQCQAPIPLDGQFCEACGTRVAA